MVDDSYRFNFRVWDRNEQEYMKFDPEGFPQDGYNLQSFVYADDDTVEINYGGSNPPTDVEQATGLFDINEDLIYEGDIVVSIVDGKPKYYEVRFTDFAFVLQELDSPYDSIRFTKSIVCVKVGTYHQPLEDEHKESVAKLESYVNNLNKKGDK